MDPIEIEIVCRSGDTVVRRSRTVSPSDAVVEDIDQTRRPIGGDGFAARLARFVDAMLSDLERGLQELRR